MIECTRVDIYTIRILKENLVIGKSDRIQTVPEYGHSLYLRHHKSYKIIYIISIFVIKYSLSYNHISRGHISS